MGLFQSLFRIAHNITFILLAGRRGRRSVFLTLTLSLYFLMFPSTKLLPQPTSVPSSKTKGVISSKVAEPSAFHSVM